MNLPTDVHCGECGGSVTYPTMAEADKRAVEHQALTGHATCTEARPSEFSSLTDD